MKLSEFNDNYIFKTRVEFGENGTEFVVLKEPTQQQFIEIREDSKESAMVTSLEKWFVKCLIDHSFEKEDGKKASNEEVYNTLKQSSSLFSEILTSWLESIPFNSRTVKPGK